MNPSSTPTSTNRNVAKMKNRLIHLILACLISAFLAPFASADFTDEWARSVTITSDTVLDSSSWLHTGSLSGTQIAWPVVPTRFLPAAVGIRHQMPQQFRSWRMTPMETSEFAFNTRGLRSLLEILRKHGSKKGSTKKKQSKKLRSGFYVATTCNEMLEPCPPNDEYIPPTVAAEQGHALAPNKLGVNAYDWNPYELVYVWLTLDDSDGHPYARRSRGRLENRVLQRGLKYMKEREKDWRQTGNVWR